MQVKVNDNGDFAENFVTDADSPSSSELVSDLYDVLCKGSYDDRDFSTITLAYEVRKVLEQESGDNSDISKWCDVLDRNDSPSELRLTDKPDDMDSEPNLGRLFWKGVGYTANDYVKYENKYNSEADIQALADVNDEGSLLKELLIEQGLVDSEETVHVPVNSNGDFIPPFVMSEGRQEGSDHEGDIPTYEEGLDRLATLMNDHFDSEVEVVEESSDDQETSDGDSDEEADGVLRGAEGVGPQVSDDIRDYIVENQVTVDWRDHIDGEEWHEAPTVVTKEEAEERVEALYGEIPSGVYTVAKQEVDEGNTNKAMTLIADFE